MSFNPATYVSDSAYGFFRFFANGRACSNGQDLDRPPTNFDINNLDGCDIGYYRLKAGEIAIEMFYPLDAGSFVTRSGTVVGDAITLEGRSSTEVYTKSKEDWMTFPTRPDW